MMAMVIIYAMCWLPLHCVTVLGDLKPSIWNFEHIQLVWIGCHWLAISSCCWNPIVYYWTNDTLRAGFTHALRTWCPCVSRPLVPPVACHRHVIYQSTLRVRGSDIQVDCDGRRPPACAPRHSPRPYYHTRRNSLDKADNVELRRMRVHTSPGYSTLSTRVRTATRSC